MEADRVRSIRSSQAEYSNVRCFPQITRVRAEHVATRKVQPGKDDDPVPRLQIPDGIVDVGVEDEPGFWSALVALTRCIREVDQRRLHVSNWHNFVFARHSILKEFAPLVFTKMQQSQPGGDADLEKWLHPSPRLGTLRRAEVLGVAGVAAAIVLVVAALGAIVGAPVDLGAIGVLLVAIAIAGFLGDRFAQRRVRAWAYCERQDDLLVRRGVMIARLSVIPYGRMQFIDVIAGPIERAFGLATIRMHTAAASSDARIPGLPQDEAARLRDRLAQLGEAKAAGL